MCIPKITFYIFGRFRFHWFDFRANEFVNYKNLKAWCQKLIELLAVPLSASHAERSSSAMARLGAEHAARSMIRDKPRHSLQRLVRLYSFSVSDSRDIHSRFYGFDFIS